MVVAVAVMPPLSVEYAVANGLFHIGFVVAAIGVMS